ncbi:MAG: hypothetical protein Q8M83_05605 [bacterium]|nr:hypothetical protein [bacterium]
MKIFIDTRELFFPGGKIVEVVSRVDLLGDDGRRQKVIWNYRDDGGNYTWRVYVVKGEQVMVGFWHESVAQILIAADLQVLAGLRQNTPGLDEHRIVVKENLIDQLYRAKEREKAENRANREEAARQQREQEKLAQAARDKKAAAERQRQETKQAEMRAEKARQKDERKREVNSRPRRPFWTTTGQRFFGTPVDNTDEMGVLVPTTHPDKEGRIFAFAVEMKGNKPVRAVKVEKKPGGQVFLHEFDFRVTFDNPDNSSASQSSAGNKVNPRLSEIWLLGPKGRQKYKMLEPAQAKDPDILVTLLNNELVVVNEPRDGQYPVYYAVRGNLMLDGYYARAKNNKTNQAVAA